jgi:hypothetical protein
VMSIKSMLQRAIWGGSKKRCVTCVTCPSAWLISGATLQDLRETEEALVSRLAHGSCEGCVTLQRSVRSAMGALWKHNRRSMGPLRI